MRLASVNQVDLSKAMTNRLIWRNAEIASYLFRWHLPSDISTLHIVHMHRMQ